jgi:hypothetical protein
VPSLTPLHQIREGDTFMDGDRPVWTAIANPVHRDHVIRIDVQHIPDGGCETREWDDTNPPSLMIRTAAER